MLSALDRAAAEGERGRARLLLPQALELGEALARGLEQGSAGAGATAMVAGSARRLADSVKDIDLVAVARGRAALARSVAELAEVERVTSASATGARAVTHGGIAIDLRIAGRSQLGNLWQHFTGSGRHNAALREQAVREGMHVSEHGISSDHSAKAKGLRHRGRGVRAARLRVHRARAARGPRRAAGRADRVRGRRRQAAAVDRAGRHQGRSALPHDRLRRTQHDRGDGARRARARV